MTSKLDRIQENANSYIVKNCPCYIDMPLYHHDKVCRLVDIVKPNHKELYVFCKGCTDCVIKQVIEKCKGAVSNYSNLEILRTACETSEAYGKANIAEQILQLFDIEEINK